MRRKPSIPDLKYDYHNASIGEVKFGPRREVTLRLLLVLWDGPIGRASDDLIQVRFGGIENLRQVKAFFASSAHERSEIARLDFVADRRSKPGQLFVEVLFERIDARITIEC